MELLPESVSGPLRGASIVFHASNSSAIEEGQVIHIHKRCAESSTANHLLLSYTVTESDEQTEWLELSINMNFYPCSYSENSIFSAQTTGNCSSLDAILVLYDYSQHGGINIHGLASKTVEKRLATDESNRTLLSEYTANGVNCSVQSVFLDYDTDFPLFPESVLVISPGITGVNMTFCFGACNQVPTLPFDKISPERLHMIGSITETGCGVCCVPDQFESESLIVFNEDKQIYELQSFPQVKTCKCVI